MLDIMVCLYVDMKKPMERHMVDAGGRGENYWSGVRGDVRGDGVCLQQEERRLVRGDRGCRVMGPCGRRWELGGSGVEQAKVWRAEKKEDAQHSPWDSERDQIGLPGNTEYAFEAGSREFSKPSQSGVFLHMQISSR